MARDGPPAEPLYLAMRSLATPGHFSAWAKVLALPFQWATIARSPRPLSQTSRHFGSRSDQGALSIFPLGGPPLSASTFLATLSNMCRRHLPITLTGPIGSIAPFQTESVGSGTSRS